VLILSSKNDMILEVDDGRELEKDLRRAGKRVEMTVYPAFQQNGHYLFSRAEGYPVFVPDAMRFLDQTLKRIGRMHVGGDHSGQHIAADESAAKDGKVMKVKLPKW